MAACGQETTEVRSVAGCPQGRYVESASDLTSRLASAHPGDVIVLAPRTYEGNFVIARSGTEKAPIILCGASGAVLDGATTERGYTLHLDHAAHWRIVGLRVQRGAKSIMFDGSSDNELRKVSAGGSGDEAVHLRSGSSRNVLNAVTVAGAGAAQPDRGEGIYVGSAKSNWCEFSDCGPDRSDENQLINVRVKGTTAEAVDIKEGTSGGVVVGGRFDGSAMTDADSLIDVKGNAWSVSGARGTAAPSRGVAVFEILAGWGERNVFRGNSFDVPSSGWAVEVYGAARSGGNVIACDNVARVSGRPDRARLSTSECRP